MGIYTGSDLLQLGPPADVANPVLSPGDIHDRPANLVADPFLARITPGWQMFVEVESKHGEIGLATSDDGLVWRYQGIVLAEPHHLSYPQVFEADGEVYMVPESYQAEAVRLYRACPYPTAWEHVADLLTGAPYSDPTLVHRNGRWWMWVEITDFSFDTVHLFSAPDLRGPWTPHPSSPVVKGDPRRARPGGRMVEHEGRLLRFAQDCVPSYGSRLRVMEVVTLTPDAYEERELPQSPLFSGTGAGWNATGMHHIDPVRLDDGSWIAAVDGWVDLEDLP